MCNLRKLKVIAAWAIVFMLMFSLIYLNPTVSTANALTFENTKHVRDTRLYERYNPYGYNGLTLSSFSTPTEVASFPEITPFIPTTERPTDYLPWTDTFWDSDKFRFSDVFINSDRLTDRLSFTDSIIATDFSMDTGLQLKSETDQNYSGRLTVTFDPGMGTVSTKSKTYEYMGTYDDFPVPERESYEFLHWVLDPLDPLSVVLPGSTVDRKGNLTLYASWKCNYYAGITVSFDEKGGTPKSDVAVFDWNGTISELPEPTKEGYEFVGWFSLPVGGEKVEDGRQLPEESADYLALDIRGFDISLYAHWRFLSNIKIEYVYQNDNIGYSIELGDTDVRIITKNELEMKTGKSLGDGKELLGWSLSYLSDDIVFTPGQTVSLEDFVYICGTDCKLYPVWQKDSDIQLDTDSQNGTDTEPRTEDDENQILNVTYYLNLPVPADIYFTATESFHSSGFDNYTVWSQEKLVNALIDQLGDTQLDQLIDISKYTLLGYAFENDAESPLFNAGEVTNLHEVFLLNSTDSLELHAIWLTDAMSYSYGDVTRDTNINLSDVVLIQKYLADLNELDEEQKILADVTGEGEITLLDVTTIQKYVAELISAFLVDDFSQNEG